MTPAHHRVHIIYSIIAVLAGIFGLGVAILTVMLGFEIAQPPKFLDLAPGFAYLGAATLCVLVVVGMLFWVPIYTGTEFWKNGTRNWAILNGVILAVNTVVIGGLVQRYRPSGTTGTVVDGFKAALAQPGGESIFLLLWPLLPIPLLVWAWRRTSSGQGFGVPS